MKILFGGITCLFLIVGLFGCELEELVKKGNSIEDGIDALQEYVMVHQQYQAVCNCSDVAVMNTEALLAGELEQVNEGPEITIDYVDVVTWPKHITVDFGEGFSGEDGILRSGKLHIVSTNWYSKEGSVHTTTCEDFYQNGYRIDGVIVATNVGEAEGLPVFNISVVDGWVSRYGDVIKYSQNTTRIWVKGAHTSFDIWDDEYTVNGNYNGVSSKGIKYALSITEPLYFVVSTREIIDGKMLGVIDGLPNMELDYLHSVIKVDGHNVSMKD